MSETKHRKFELVARKVTFAEAEDIDIEFYAFQYWKDSAELVEEMRRGIWSKEYKLGMEKVGNISKLQEDRDDIE